MFDTLATVPLAVAIEVVYQVTLRLFERTRFTTRAEALARRAATMRAAGSSAAERRVELAILDEIEGREGRRLPELSDAQANRYTAELVEMLFARMRREQPVDERKGLATLERMRARYGTPGRAA
jgi:hypothetical protein